LNYLSIFTSQFFLFQKSRDNPDNLMNTINRSAFISYILSGRLLHMITIIELIGVLIFVPIIFNIQIGQNPAFLFLKLAGIIYLISLPIFAQLDARSRFQNYKKIKDQLYIYGFDKRILRHVLKSRCQRDAALIAATELGLKESCTLYFQFYGYRWYHLLQDFVFRKPLFLFTKYFWFSTFFTPGYKPKIDFSNISENNIRIRFENLIANA